MSVEKWQLESVHTLDNALAFFVPIAWGQLRLRVLAREYPDLPATSVLERPLVGRWLTRWPEPAATRQ